MQINTQIPEEIAQKINLIKEKTQQELPEILQKAISLYYESLKPSSKTPLQILEESGFIGCCSIEEDLSTNYKQVLTESLEQKYDYR